MRLPIALELPVRLPIALALAAERVAIPILAKELATDSRHSRVAFRSTTNAAPLLCQKLHAEFIYLSGCNKFIFSDSSSYLISLPAPSLGGSCPSRISASRISFAIGIFAAGIERASPVAAAPTMDVAKKHFLKLKLNAFLKFKMNK